jgi:hypothetical protein
MISFINKTIQSTVDNLFDSLAFLMVAFFYGLSILKLPVAEMFHMFGILVVFTVGINVILFSGKHIPTQL